MQDFFRCIVLVATEQYCRLRSKGRAVLVDNDGHACGVRV